jgi:hypothetical protein
VKPCVPDLVALSASLALAPGTRPGSGTYVKATQCRCLGPVYRRVSTRAEAAESVAAIQPARGALFVGVAGRTRPRLITPGFEVPVRPACPFRVERQWAGALRDTVTTFGSVYGWCGDPKFIVGRRYVVQRGGSATHSSSETASAPMRRRTR